ncbi:riboflavin biosynthesis protein RibF [Anoxybacter fermentans]|uniref:Riboflavin biosynthesis protein n=1 Tax=Anoxybacter fermentans TaxID=1323375 RepID=A0A3Q9HP50_9FIRM|nr:bifunctional riboflavin kinase/FAD synthetase [Anoxybacter fermentans]AZR72397.1 riboflavin biosynthesis protein RibF [Anoxybacter fermentans]
MQLITDEEIMKNHDKPMIVALGFFDGIHYGHRVIIEETVRQARESNVLSGVFTFHPHPLKVLAPKRAPGLITALSQKRRILAEMGVDRLIVKAFTKEFAATDFRSFVQTYLVQYLKVKGVVVGEDFRFGKESKGDATAMKELGEKYGFTVTVFDTIRVNGVEVRSTLIRNLILKGQMDKLLTYLGRPYTLVGKVVRGDGRGHQLGFPTANLSLAVDYVIPDYGVYAGYIIVHGKRYQAVANIGVRPTFAKSDLSIEIHILDYSGNLYDEIVEIELIKKIRSERSFDSIDELVAQIKDDIVSTRQILSNDITAKS